MPDRAEVAIIGAGLAGCAAAITLGGYGIRSVVFEKGRPFKDKACGDAFMPSAIANLHDLGLSNSHFISLGGTHFGTIDLFDNSKLIWRHELKKEVGWMLPRLQLDQALRDVAEKTALIFYDAKVKAVTAGTNSHWTIRFENSSHHEMKVRVVILATGADNKLSRTFRISGAPLPSASLSAYTRGHRSNSLVFQFTDLCQGGYAWIFPVNEQMVNVGMCVVGDQVRKLKRSAEHFVNRRQLVAPGLHWRGGKEPLWSGNTKQWHHQDGLVSCGDAAGLIDPLNGEGITAALHSGRLAAKHVHAYLNNHADAEHLQDYSNAVRDFFTQRYALTMQRIVWRTLCRL